jgi:hypothetical protein
VWGHIGRDRVCRLNIVDCHGSRDDRVSQDTDRQEFVLLSGHSYLSAAELQIGPQQRLLASSKKLLGIHGGERTLAW